VRDDWPADALASLHGPLLASTNGLGQLGLPIRGDDVQHREGGVRRVDALIVQIEADTVIAK
jgi:hypothetical protein